MNRWPINVIIGPWNVNRVPGFVISGLCNLIMGPCNVIMGQWNVITGTCNVNMGP